MKIKNAKTPPKVYYALHMCEGVAEYVDKNFNDGKPYRILILEDVLREMDPTFDAKPVYVFHVDKVNLENIQEEADGFVSESFLNRADGKHWTKFLAVSDEAHEAIAKGWKVSNAYKILDSAGAGQWHNVDYLKRVTKGEYEHLAIVPNPRYEESVIMTEEQFKAYNAEKLAQLERVANSKTNANEDSSLAKQGEKTMLNLFKKTKVENSADFEGMSVTLPKSKRELTLTQLVNEADEIEAKKGEKKMANGDDFVSVGDEEMSVNELIDKYQSLSKPKNEPTEEEKKAAEEKAAAEKKANDDAAAKKKSEEEEAKKKAENSKGTGNYEKLQNARDEANKNKKPAVIETMTDQLARGQSLYGSSKK